MDHWGVTSGLLHNHHHHHMITPVQHHQYMNVVLQSRHRVYQLYFMRFCNFHITQQCSNMKWYASLFCVKMWQSTSFVVSYYLDAWLSIMKSNITLNLSPVRIRSFTTCPVATEADREGLKTRVMKPLPVSFVRRMGYQPVFNLQHYVQNLRFTSR